MLELSLRETLVVVHHAISDELDLRLARDRLQVRMKDRLLRLAGLVVPVSVVLRRWIERLRQEILLLGGQLGIAEEQCRVLNVAGLDTNDTASHCG